MWHQDEDNLFTWLRYCADDFGGYEYSSIFIQLLGTQQCVFMIEFDHSNMEKKFCSFYGNPQYEFDNLDDAKDYVDNFLNKFNKLKAFV